LLGMLEKSVLVEALFLAEYHKEDYRRDVKHV